MKDVSYMDLSLLEDEFERQCKENGITWIDEDVKMECLNDFILQYENGVEEPEIRLLGYGYE